MLTQEQAGFFQVNGLRMYVERAGRGETLLYISGTGADLRNKPNQLDSPFAGRFNMVCFLAGPRPNPKSRRSVCNGGLCGRRGGAT